MPEVKENTTKNKEKTGKKITALKTISSSRGEQSVSRHLNGIRHSVTPGPCKTIYRQWISTTSSPSHFLPGCMTAGEA